MQGLNYLALSWVSNPIMAKNGNRKFLLAYLILLLCGIWNIKKSIFTLLINQSNMAN